VFISIGLGMMVSYRAVRPIQDITAAATRVSRANDLTTRLPTKVPDDEIGRLTKVFNHMMARLEYIFGVQQRFVADLSHELRTPLTAIQGNLDIIKRFGADEESIQAIQDETHRMTRMVKEVLMLARADYGDITIDLYPLDLEQLVVESVATFPALVEKPVIYKEEFPIHVVFLSIYGDMDAYMREEVAQEVRDELMRLPAVNQIQILGTDHPLLGECRQMENPVPEGGPHQNDRNPG